MKTLAHEADADAIPEFRHTDIEIPYQQFTLSNGLQLIVHEDHKAPIVAVNVWYHVGSKNEKPGKSGLAHLFEHLMFNGSENFNDDYSPAQTCNMCKAWHWQALAGTALAGMAFISQNGDRCGCARFQIASWWHSQPNWIWCSRKQCEQPWQQHSPGQSGKQWSSISSSKLTLERQCCEQQTCCPLEHEQVHPKERPSF